MGNIIQKKSNRIHAISHPNLQQNYDNGNINDNLYNMRLSHYKNELILFKKKVIN
jgi:hypothetical protein